MGQPFINHSLLSPVPPPAAVMTAVRQLEPLAANHVTDQHVVSKVLLGEFTELRGKNQEQQLAGLDLTWVNSSPRYGGPKMFGKVPNFIKFASGSAEALWQQTENKIRPMLNAVADGTLFDNPAYLDVIRDTFALHLVRSIPAAFIHHDAWTVNRELAQQEILRYPNQLDEIFYRTYGVYPTGPEARNMAADVIFAEATRIENRGTLFRFGTEDRFNRYRTIIAGYGVEILKAKRSEFLIGDSPALTIRYGRPLAGVTAGVGLLWANELVLPFGPKWLAMISRHGTNRFVAIPQQKVQKYNVMQIQSAYRHVHFRPSSGLETLIRSTKRPTVHPELPN